jgi:hypothetical protein
LINEQRRQIKPFKRSNTSKTLIKPYDINDTQLFLSELESLIHLDSRASIETHNNTNLKKRVYTSKPINIINLFSPRHEFNPSPNIFPKLEEIDLVKTINSTRILRFNKFERRTKYTYPENDSD